MSQNIVQADLQVGAEQHVVDAPTAQEFLVEIYRRATREQLDAISAAVERKSALFAAALSPEAIGRLEPEGLRLLLRRIFTARRKVSNVLGSHDAATLRANVSELLYGTGPLEARFEAYCATTMLEPQVAAEVASELLHFSDPARYWLWARWMWNPRTRTGSLPLLVSEDHDLEADGLGEGYLRVGQAVRSLDETAEAAAFRPPGGGPLGTDVFLACCYGVYMQLVLGMKMSDEFNSVTPQMPELTRRLLGVNGKDD